MKDIFGFKFRIGGGEFEFFIGWFWIAVLVIIVGLLVY